MIFNFSVSHLHAINEALYLIPYAKREKMKKTLLIFVCALVLSVAANAKTSRSVLPVIPSLERLSDPSFDEFDDLIKAAFDLYKQQKYDEALAACAKATAIRPNDIRPHYVSGLVYMAQWKMKSASEEFGKGISINPGVKQLYYLKASADRYRDAREDAIAAAHKAIEIDPNFAEAYVVLAESLAMGSKEEDAAIQAFRTAIKLKPDLFSAYTQLGIYLEAKKDYKGAEEIYRKAMELDPQKMACRFSLGRMLVKQGRLVEARAVWEGRAWDKDNIFPNLITVLERAENLKRATDNLEKKPNDPDALVQMGEAVMDGDSWVVDGRQERAITYFAKALAIKPDLAKAQYNICKAYIHIADTFKDKNKKVDEELAKLRKIDPKLADEMVDYRKNYSGGIKGIAASPDQ